jgi:CDP-glucose 4,6-dehydratase
VRPWQHVLDVLAGYLKLGKCLLEGDPKFACAWNFGPSHDEIVTVKEISNRMRKLWNKIDVNASEDAADLHEAQILRLDSTKARAYLSWKPVMNLDAVIDRTVSWYKRFYEDQRIISEDQIRQYQLETQ